MRKKIMPFLAVAIVLFCIPVVFSANEFEVGAIGGDKMLCPTHTASITVPVENTGDQEASYSISLDGSAQKWAVAAPTGFTLESGEVKTVYVWVTPSSGTLPGTYDLTITVDGGSAGEKKVEYQIVVESCHDVKVEAVETSKKSCPGETTSYNININNTGEYTESYELSLNGVAKEWATLSRASLKLESGTKDTVKLYIESPVDAQAGSYGLTVTASSKDSDALDSTETETVLESCYDYSIETSKDVYSFCDHTKAKIPVTITNKGVEENAYSLELSGPEWASLENNKIEVSKGESRVVNLTIFPDYYETGEFDLNIKGVSKTGEVSKEKNVSLNIRSCFDTNVDLSTTEDTICAQSSKSYKVSLTNAGEYEEPYSVSTEGPDWVSLDKNFVKLGAGKTQELTLTANAPKEAGEYTITVKAKSQQPSETSDTSELNLKVVSKEVCFSVDLTAELNKVDVARGEGALIPVNVNNKGKEKAEYTLEVSGAGASFAQLTPSTLKVKAGNTKTAHLYIAIPEEAAQEKYTLSVSAELEDGTVSASDKVEVSVVEAGEGVSIGEETEEGPSPGEQPEEEENETQISTGVSMGERIEEIKTKAGKVLTSAKNKVYSVASGVTSVSKFKENWKYVVAVIIVIIILILIWEGLKEEGEGSESSEKGTEDKGSGAAEKEKSEKKKPKKKKEVVKKIRELLEEEE